MKDGWKLKNTYASLPKFFFTEIEPSKVPEPEMVVLNKKLAEKIGLDFEELSSKENIGIFAGNKLPEGSKPIAQAYGGHQFGYFNKLGDGRAVLLGEQVTSKGLIDIQLKGSGKTPYSRGGDGKATLGPMLREYIISEAMEGLNIPTTGSLAVVKTGERIFRDGMLPGAVLTRTASSHLRVGTFQYASVWGDVHEIKELADYAIKRHFKDLEMKDDKYILFLREVIRRQAETIAKWEMVGFIHGVMNTDNMTISGETIDYGPCAFMDRYDPKTVFSSIDTGGRYAYGNQAYIGAWNLARFGETLIPLLHENKDEAVKIAQMEISVYKDIHHSYWLDGMRKKLGLHTKEPEDIELITELLKIMENNKSDFTNTFRAMTLEKYDEMHLFKTDEFRRWKERYQYRIEREGTDEKKVKELMRNNNPSIIPRNYLVEEALNEAVRSENYEVMNELVKALKNPYAYTEEQEQYAVEPPEMDKGYRTFCGT